MKKTLTIIIALAAVSSFAFAQQGGGQRGQGGGQRGQGGQEQGSHRANQADLVKKVAEIVDDKQEARLAELVI